MPTSSIAPLHVDLDFNSPLSNGRVIQIMRALQPLAGARVIDLGCGWAELLLRIAAAEPSVTATGVDTDRTAIAHGRINAIARGLDDRVALHIADVAHWRAEPADIAICIGAGHAWGGTAAALDALWLMLRPSGRVLLGEGFWRGTPTDAARAALDGEQLGSLADLVELAVLHGLRPLAVSEASIDEWDAFESGYALAWEKWLLANPGAPEADQIRAQADEHRSRWLRGYRGHLGFAYLTLARSDKPDGTVDYKGGRIS